MKSTISIVIILTLFHTTLFAKKSYFNPYKPTVSKKIIKKRIKRKRKRVKKIKKKYRTTKFAKNLDRIYRKVLKKTDISRRALKRAFEFYKKNRVKKGLSSKYLAIADYTKTARNKRLYIINLRNGAVYRHKIAHGKYSGAIGGRVKRSSNRRNSKMTPYGFFKVGSKVHKTKKRHYKYLSVQGLERSNRKVGYPPRLGGRDIILHPAKYVNYGGRSHGCFSICPQDRYKVFAKLKRALLYSYTGR
jgi:hypothetical protein